MSETLTTLNEKYMIHSILQAPSSTYWDLKLPGHTKCERVTVAKFGQTQIYFYMTDEKHEAGQQLIGQINAKQIKLVPDVYLNPRSTEMSAIASILPQDFIDASSIPFVIEDDRGQRVLNEYAAKTKQIVEKLFDIHIVGASREINFIVSHDAHSFHRDNFPQQFKYLGGHISPEKRFAIIHDLTLVDWDMADHTISGTIFHDPISHDRFLVYLLPKDEVAMFSIEPIDYHDTNPPLDPGAALLPYHTVLSPEDLDGTQTAGSSKGQRISTVLRGLIDTSKKSHIAEGAQELPIQRPVMENETIAYPNGIVLRPFIGLNIPSFALTNVTVLPEKQSVEIIEISMHAHTHPLVSCLRSLFEIELEYNISSCYQIIKREGGFTLFKELDLPIASDSIILLINRSVLSDKHKHYQIAEDQSDLGLPWIQLYQFDPRHVMMVTPDLFRRLSLVPLIELIYRDERQCQGERKSCKRFFTKIDVLIFSKGT